MIANCKTHVDTEVAACRECNQGFILKGYDATKDFGTSCASATQFDAGIQDANLLGKNLNNKCLAFLANGDCDRCADEYVLVKNPPGSPTCQNN